MGVEHREVHRLSHPLSRRVLRVCLFSPNFLFYHTISRVLGSLSDLLNLKLSHISPLQVVVGNETAVMDLVEILDAMAVDNLDLDGRGYDGGDVEESQL